MEGLDDPGLLLDGEVIIHAALLVEGCHSTDHILAIQWAFVPLAKGGPGFKSRLCLNSGDGVMEEVIWVHGVD